MIGRRLMFVPTDKTEIMNAVAPERTSAESIPTLNNHESIHFGFLLRGFVEKESIHDT